MGLPERRQIHHLQTEVLPQRSQEIAEICGTAVPYEVDWASIEHDAQALNFLDNTACHRVNMALRVICMDTLGREAVASGLRRVQLRNVADPAQRHIGFADGVLTLHNAFAHGAAGLHDDGTIRNVLLAGL